MPSICTDDHRGTDTDMRDSTPEHGVCPLPSREPTRAFGVLPHRLHPVGGQLEEVPIRVGVVEEIAFVNQRLHTTLEVRTGDAVREKPPALRELLATDLAPHALQLPLKQLENHPLDMFCSRHC